ncbi:hypothetical protein CRG98_008944 [Punica granatum]|uniref:Uncharacterized protein n=1 Tax=Punica granatum TaxID=22663 RepID=A0A2I0KQH1_PUNGR|nr:hypothetical protein CRG98_008944 [Punica granatum]
MYSFPPFLSASRRPPMLSEVRPLEKKSLSIQATNLLLPRLHGITVVFVDVCRLDGKRKKILSTELVSCESNASRPQSDDNHELELARLAADYLSSVFILAGGVKENSEAIEWARVARFQPSDNARAVEDVIARHLQQTLAFAASHNT